MPWVKVDDQFQDHPKFLDVSLAGVGLWVAGLAYCSRYLTDGYVAAKAAKRLGGTKRLIDELEDAGLWHPDDGGGWYVHDYLTYNPSAEEVKDTREKRAKAGRLGGLARGEQKHTEADVKQIAKHGADPLPSSRPVPSRPLPLEPSEKSDKSENLDTSPHLPAATNGHLDTSPPPSNGVLPNGSRSRSTDEGFAQFWDTYPKRDGRKIGKARALSQWQKLRPTDRALALVAVGHYADERGGPGQLSPEDAQRWLRNGTWAEFAEPPDPVALAAANGRRQRPSVAERLAAIQPTDRGN